MTTQKTLLDNLSAKQYELFKTIRYLVAYIALFLAMVLLVRQASEHPFIPKSEPTRICTNIIDSKCTQWQ